MLTITATGRYSKCVSNEVITAGSVGIPAVFNLNEDFDGLSPIAVFRGSGVSFDVALIGSEVIVPHEVLTNVGGILEVGVYARNGEGTIVIPTVWSVAGTIREGAIASGVDPSEPTPDWTAQVQAAASEAVQAANDAKDIAENAKEVAITSADSAQKSAVSANNSAARSSAAANAADRARDSAERYRDDTLTYSVIADESANSARTYAQNAETSARDASNSADVATQKAATASEAATNAARSEENTFNSAKEAIDASDNAEQAAEQASLSARRADESSQNAAESARLAALSETAANASALTANEAKIASETAQSEAEAAKTAAETAKNRSEELYDYVSEANRSATEAAALAVAAKTDAETAAESATESAAIVQEVADRLPTIEENLDIAINTANDARITLFDGTSLIDYAVRDLNYTGTPGKSDSTCLAIKRRGNRIVLNGGNINNASKPNAFVKLTGNTTGRTINSSTIRNWSDGITLKSGRMYKVTVLYVSGETSAVSVPATSLSVDNLGESATIGYASRDGYGRFIRYFVATQELNLILYVPCYQITYTDYTVDVILEEVDETVGEYLPSMVTNKALAVGDFRIVDGELFRVTAPVASGGTLIPGANCVKTTLSGQIDTLNDTVDGLSGDVNALESDVTDTQSMLATVESNSTASKEYAIGDLLVFDGKLYKGVSAISLGDTLIPDGNIELTTVEQQLSSSGGGAVDDVQINGTSIVENGVANIGPATTQRFGLVKYSNSQAIVLDGLNNLKLQVAGEAAIKQGTGTVLPSAVASQHIATFYGLAKAAGSDEKNSTLPVGQYTDAAKSAIQSMLNVPDKSDIDSKAPSIYKVIGPSAIVSFADGADDMPLKSLTVAIKPVQDGSGDPSPENVRPISGWTGARVCGTNRNLLASGLAAFQRLQQDYGSAILTIDTTAKTATFDSIKTSIYRAVIVNLDGKTNVSAANKGRPFYPFKANTQYTFIFKADSTSNALNIAVSYTDGTNTGSFSKAERNADGFIVFTTPANKTVNSLYIGKYSGTSTFYYDTFGVFEGVVTYDEYVAGQLTQNGTTISISFPDEAGTTVYGGTLTINADGSVELAVNWYRMRLLSSWGWHATSSARYYLNFSTAPAAKYVRTSADHIRCSALKSVPATASSTDYSIMLSSERQIMCRLESSTTLDDLIHFLDANEVFAVYEMKTPVTYQLTAEQIRTLAGVNNLWSDAGDVTAVYPVDTKTYVDTKAAALSGQIDALEAAQPRTVTVTGTTPVIAAVDNTRYKCGEVSTLDITLPASGIVDVFFTSGTTPTVLTVTPPNGVTMRWANGFDPTNIAQNTTYEINILDGLGVACTWI